MGLRFRKSLRLFLDFHVNVSKTGISESIGESPSTVNLHGDRARDSTMTED